MKLVVAIIKPFKLDEVREALSSLGVQGITVTDVKGFGRQKGHTELYRGAEYVVDFLPKVKIEAAMADDLVDRSIEAIEKSANTGKIGDGKVFVFDLLQVVGIPPRQNRAEERCGALPIKIKVIAIAVAGGCHRAPPRDAQNGAPISTPPTFHSGPSGSASTSWAMRFS